MIYAGLKADDPRVVAAMDFIRKHYSLTDNPGMGKAGLYYYYHTFAKALDVVGLMNIQFAIKDGNVYILEVNPRASRTVPFVAKATAVPVAKIAARVMAGKRVADSVRMLVVPGSRQIKHRAEEAGLARIFEEVRKKSEADAAQSGSPFAEITDDDIDNLFND